LRFIKAAWAKAAFAISGHRSDTSPDGFDTGPLVLVEQPMDRPTPAPANEQV